MCFLDIIVKIVTIIGVFIALVTYWKKIELERTNWLSKLYDKFYEQKSYKKIRTIIDYREHSKIDDYNELVRSVEPPYENIKLVEGLVDYLNFFEFIATLNKTNQLTIKETNLVFGYYINEINKCVEIRKFIEKSGFQNLGDLINQISPLRNI